MTSKNQFAFFSKRTPMIKQQFSWIKNLFVFSIIEKGGQNKIMTFSGAHNLHLNFEYFEIFFITLQSI